MNLIFPNIENLSASKSIDESFEFEILGKCNLFEFDIVSNTAINFSFLKEFGFGLNDHVEPKEPSLFEFGISSSDDYNFDFSKEFPVKPQLSEEILERLKPKEPSLFEFGISSSDDYNFDFSKEFPVKPQLSEEILSKEPSLFEFGISSSDDYNFDFSKEFPVKPQLSEEILERLKPKPITHEDDVIAKDVFREEIYKPTKEGFDRTRQIIKEVTIPGEHVVTKPPQQKMEILKKSELLKLFESKTEDIDNLKEEVGGFIEKQESRFQDQMTKIRGDFISLQNQLNQKINNMSLFASSSGGGGEVNMLRLDDVDTTNLSVNKSYPKYNTTTKKIEFVSAAEIGQAISVTDEDVQVFTVDATMVTNQYITLQSEIATGTELYTEVDFNGLSQSYTDTFSLVNGYRDRLDISEFGIAEGDFIRVRWKKA